MILAHRFRCALSKCSSILRAKSSTIIFLPLKTAGTGNRISQNAVTCVTEYFTRQRTSQRLSVPYHNLPQQEIRSRLVPLALLAEPGKHIGIQAKCYLLLNGAVERIRQGILPELIGQFGNIRQIDFMIRAGRKFGEFPLASCGGLTLIEYFSDDFAHSGFFPFALLAAPK